MIESSARTHDAGEPAAATNLLKFDDAEDAYQVLYGLALRDVHIRLLLGETASRPAEHRP